MSGSDHEIVSVATFLEYRARRLRPPVTITQADAPPDDALPTDHELGGLASAAVISAPPRQV
jgi:hypothetical protein